MFMKRRSPAVLAAIIAVLIAAVILSGCGEKEIPIVRTEFETGDYFVVNLKDSNRLLKITIVLVLDTDTLEEMMTSSAFEIRDTIATILRDQDEETMRSIDLSGVKEKIRTGLNEKLEIDNITDILFTDIAVQ